MVELVGKEDLPQAIGLNSTGFNLARVMGPSVAAIVVAQLGVSWTFGLNALSYLAVLVALWMIHLAPARRISRAIPVGGGGFREAWTYIPVSYTHLTLPTICSV